MRLSTLTKLVFFLPLIALAEDEFTVYTPKYRATEELVGLGQGAFGNKASFSALNGKVVINASPKTTASVLKLFGAIDQAPKKYRLSFRLVSKASNQQGGVGLEGGSVSVGKKPTIGGRIKLEDSRGETQAFSEQSVQVLEGSEAQLAFGRDWGLGGFSAKVRTVGPKGVTVDFRQRESNANPTFSLSSEVSLRTGEWRSVGGVTQSNSASQKGILNRSGGSGAGAKDLQVKVELDP